MNPVCAGPKTPLIESVSMESFFLWFFCKPYSQGRTKPTGLIASCMPREISLHINIYIYMSSKCLMCVYVHKKHGCNRKESLWLWKGMINQTIKVWINKVWKDRRMQRKKMENRNENSRSLFNKFILLLTPTNNCFRKHLKTFSSVKEHLFLVIVTCTDIFAKKINKMSNKMY